MYVYGVSLAKNDYGEQREIFLRSPLKSHEEGLEIPSSKGLHKANV